MRVFNGFGGALALITWWTATLTAQGGIVDPKRLPLGDGKVSSSARQGFVWACNAQFGARGGGAHAAGPWIKSDGTYDFTAKAVVDGQVSWPHAFTIVRTDTLRRISGNDLPSHPTGTFPIGPVDDAFNYDRNPNSIRAQPLGIDMPANPAKAERPSCLPMGPIGVLLSGGYFFNALDLRGEDAVAHEIQDSCQGHPQASGAYHYHNLSSCVDDGGNQHSGLVGYAFDGFGIFGKRGENGKILSNSDLDECHGHTHGIEWDGRTIAMYHYHATWEYPYTIGCFRGTPAAGALQQGRGRGPAGRAGRGPAAAGIPPSPAVPGAQDFSVITLGTGTPRYDPARAGPSNAIRVGDRYLIVDAGNGVQARMQQAGVALDKLDAILITHHHLDHDQELMPLLITAIVRGNAPLIIGAPGTVAMVDFMKEFYAEDMKYRMERAPGADIDPASLRGRDVSGGEEFNVGATSVRTARVNHTIHTIAFRFERGGRSIVISGDLSFSESLVTLARGADVLVIDGGALPGTDESAGRAAGASGGRGGPPVGGRAARGRGNPAPGAAQSQRAHPTLEEVASMASQAGVRCLVLSHINQTNVDTNATLARLRPTYSGPVIIASDLAEVSTTCEVAKRG